MKIWLLPVLVFILAACSADSGYQSAEDINAMNVQSEGTENEEGLEGNQVAGGNDMAEETAGLSASLTSYERPFERRERDDSSIMSYVREGIEPYKIEIPAIGVEAEIENVGLLPNGQMDEPEGMDDVAWYEGGYKPGEQGSSVLAGHVDSRTGPAIFFDLHKLQEGDEIIVTDENGNEKVFIVQRSESYDRLEAPLQQIFGYSYRSQLNLITCTGEFNSEAGTHDERLVVYTVLKDDLQHE